MVRVVREEKVPVILMHMYGRPRTMQTNYRYGDVVADIIDFFRGRLQESGLTENVILDPGLGFGKSVEHNFEILHRLKEFTALGFPVMIELPENRFWAVPWVLEPRIVWKESRAAAVAVYNGASIVRVHDVLPTVRVVRVVEALRTSGVASPSFRHA